MTSTHLQPSFTGGEISPSLQARIDSPAYNTWLHTARNFYVHPQGGASNRPGTVFVATAKYTNKACRVIPFVINEEESYVIEMGDTYLRVFTPAGRVLDDESEIYEITSPYTAEELAQVQYVQYNQTLFFTHPSHAPRRLVRTSAGRFTLEVLPIKGGPFKPGNADTTHQLRVIQSQETIETDGVKASVSFLPTVDPNYFVWGYFNGEQFFYAHGYGLDIEFLVSEFNRVYGSAGYAAYNLGGVMKIESPQATGGDCNGNTLVLEYRNSFTRPAVYTLSYTLAGGANAGEIEVEGGELFLLESDFDLFSPSHVGGRFSLTHAMENPFVSGTISYDGTSSTFKTGGDWQLYLSGSWTGQIVLEQSTDLGATWQTHQTFSRVAGDDAIATQGVLEDTGGLYYLRLRGLNITGEAAYELNTEPFVQEGIVLVTDFVSARQVQVTVEQNFGSSSWTSNWAEGSFSPKNGYPACGFFFQDRFGLAGTSEEPQTVWFSKTGDYTHFGHRRAALADDDSFSIHLSSKQLNAIRATAVAGKLLVFTAGSEWSISCAGALTPSTVEVNQQGQRGAGAVAPVVVGNRVLFVQARAGTLRDFYYDYATASYTGNDLTLYAKHLFFNQEICELCYQQEPDYRVWCVLKNGQLATLTYLAEQDVCAWSHHDTQGSFRSVCTIPHAGYDEVWLAVERSNGWNIEKMSNRLASYEPQDQLFMDAAVSFKADESFSTLTGLSHLNGQTVAILADGNVLSPQTVQSGTLTLPHAVYQAQVGLAYTAQLQTLPVGVQNTTPDKAKRIVSITLKLLDSRGGKAGMAGEPLEELIQRTDENFNSPIALQTGDFPLSVAGHCERGACVQIEQAVPLPLTVLSLTLRLA